MATEKFVNAIKSIEYDVESFLYFCNHLPAYFESFENGLITYSTLPHPHTGRVFKVRSNNLNLAPSRYDGVPMDCFVYGGGSEKRYTTWGEIYSREGELIHSTMPYLSWPKG